jgi:glutamyl-tRNA synthetase
MNNIRVRYAPSPTGWQHPGGIRTALFCWLFARHHQGTFILRIEDTDKAREVKEAVEYLYKSLSWLGLNWDEGPNVEGKFGPYKQSKRLNIYHKYVRQLIDKDLAYADPYSQEQVNEYRQVTKATKKPFLFRDFRPKNPPVWKLGLPLRFKVPELKRYEWQDAVRGKLSAGPEALDDIIILKADGYPTYNFANVIDDHLMQISHVLRGEEYIASIPKYLSLYDAFGWRAPINATMPLVLAKTGGKKLSKRDGSLPILEYKELGYLPQAINNFLATLGWNDGTTQEVFTVKELIEKFSLDRLQKSPARFEIERLDWLNSQHLRQLKSADLLEATEEFWPPEFAKTDRNFKKRLLEVELERIKTLAALKDLPKYFIEFEKPKNLAELKQQFRLDMVDMELKDWLKEVSEAIKSTEITDKESFMKKLKMLVESHGGRKGTLFSVLRETLCGNEPKTPPIWEVVYVLGAKEATERLSAIMSDL